MYLHIGGDFLLRSEDIIGIFDIENTSISKITKEFLKESEKRKKVITTSFDLPRSYVLDKENRVYVSPISPATLLKRIESDRSGRKDLDAYESLPELLEKVQYYLTHEEERIEIAIHGYEKTARLHSYENRLAEMMQMILQ